MSKEIVSYIFVFIIIFFFAWITTFGWQNRELIAELFYESNLEKYNVATGQAGPATFYIYHQDFEALERLSQSSDEILGVEMTKKSGRAAMAFTSAQVNAIETVRSLPAVSAMLRRNIPMLCH